MFKFRAWGAITDNLADHNAVVVPVGAHGSINVYEAHVIAYAGRPIVMGNSLETRLSSNTNVFMDLRQHQRINVTVFRIRALENWLNSREVFLRNIACYIC